MAIRSILAPLSGEEPDENALASALRLARRLGAVVDCLHVSPDARELIPFLAEGVVGPASSQIMEMAERESGERAAKAERIYRAACKRARVAASGEKAIAAYRRLTGRASELVPIEARIADLVAFGRTPKDAEADWRFTLEATLLGGGRPVLVLPAERVERIGRAVAIAWNGSPEAARAAAAALPFLAKAERVLLLSGSRGAPVVPSAVALGGWLARHRLPGKIETVELRAWPVGDGLADEAAGAGADLLVMGGYGHSRMRETILGGATRAVLDAAPLPVLIAH